jgi:VIT1/CCC1 family predicted Fe2+/Mn2+ transporter
VASKIAGVRRAESAMLHGAVVWLLAVPLLLVLAALGAGGYFGGWYSGLAGTPPWVTPPSSPVDPDAALAARNSALGAITALLLGLIGSVIGGWLGSRKPMASYDDRAPSVTTGRPVV